MPWPAETSAESVGEPAESGLRLPRLLTESNSPWNVRAARTTAQRRPTSPRPTAVPRSPCRDGTRACGSRADHDSLRAHREHGPPNPPEYHRDHDTWQSKAGAAQRSRGARRGTSWIAPVRSQRDSSTPCLMHISLYGDCFVVNQRHGGRQVRSRVRRGRRRVRPVPAVGTRRHAAKPQGLNATSRDGPRTAAPQPKTTQLGRPTS